jgi:hypothetical protein
MPARWKARLTSPAATVLLLSAACLALGGTIGLLWALSEPENAPHGGLYIGLPGGVLVLQSLAMATAGASIHHKWAGYKLYAPVLIGLVPAICLVHPGGFLVAGLIGLTPFTILARLLTP